ncbi:MAG TPA: hypothetical protein DG753_09315 [Clostridium sp.]|nr:hypothetical protein [Clostridium sp.]
MLYANTYPRSVENIVFENPSLYFKESMKSIQNKLVDVLLKNSLHEYVENISFSINNEEDIKVFINELTQIPEDIRNEVYHIAKYSDYTEEQKELMKVTLDSDERWINLLLGLI